MAPLAVYRTLQSLFPLFPFTPANCYFLTKARDKGLPFFRGQDERMWVVANEINICQVQLKFPDGRGLQGRAASMLVKLERLFDAELLLECRGQRANGKSIIGLLSLEAGPCPELTATATGPDAEPMIEALKELFASGFRPTEQIPASSLFRRKFAHHFNLRQ
jgi:phosphotransferase system HPr (HPr) family protein